MTETTIITAFFSLLTAVAVLWLNPRRLANQAFSIVSIVQAAWLGCIYMAMQHGAKGSTVDFHQLEFWLRANAAVVAFLPWTLMIMKDAIIDQRKWSNFIRPSGWIVATIVMVALCYQESFISSNQGFGRGAAYWAFSALAVGCCLCCVVEICRQLPKLKGIKRVEMQFLGLTAGIAALVIACINTLGNVLEVRALNRSTVLWVFAAYAIMACALIFHRIFNARQIFAIVAQRAALFCVFCGGVLVTTPLLTKAISETPAQVTAIFACCLGTIWLHKNSKRWLGIDDDLIIANARSEVIDLSLDEACTEKIRNRSESYLRAHFQVAHVELQDTGSSEKPNPWLALSTSNTYQVLCRASWATPESLQRQRSSPASVEIRNFLIKHSLAVVVTVPRGSLTPSLIVALGGKANDAPFTYPEVVRLQNIAELMDNTLTRSQLTTQAALQAKMEHLAMMSRGLAHDLKNLITPISSYLVHTAPLHATGSLESEVYASAERSVGVMNDYVREALFFSERMELKYESVSLRRIFDEVTAITAIRGRHAGVQVTTDIGTVESLRVDGVLILRMLANLVANAIDASLHGKTVHINAAPRGLGWVRLQVIDQGHGIPPEHLERMFDPYFTTKEFGETVRGFGLGLTITQKIVNLHSGKISVQSKIGEGSTLTIDLPVAPPGSMA